MWLKQPPKNEPTKTRWNGTNLPIIFLQDVHVKKTSILWNTVHQLIGSLSHYSQGFIHPRWLAGFLNHQQYHCIKRWTFPMQKLVMLVGRATFHVEIHVLFLGVFAKNTTENKGNRPLKRAQSPKKGPFQKERLGNSTIFQLTCWSSGVYMISRWPSLAPPIFFA